MRTKCAVCSTKGYAKETVRARMTVDHEGKTHRFSKTVRGVHTGCTNKGNKTFTFRHKRNSWEKTIRVCCCRY